ncbi:hypothetical protein NDK25_22170 [Niallia taxi]|nr:hypothetical protein [Niallia taxi]MDE5054925.1 hypothetical protein [Niallia taxi]
MNKREEKKWYNVDVLIFFIFGAAVIVMMFSSTDVYEPTPPATWQIKEDEQERVELIYDQADRFLDSTKKESNGLITSIIYGLSGEVTVTTDSSILESMSDEKIEEFKEVTATEIEWGLHNYGPFLENENITVKFIDK